MMKAALVHLLPGIDSAKQESFLSVLEARSVTNNTYDIPGWDAHLLNEQMLDMLEADCAHTAELIEKEGFYRWSEEHKQSLKIVADSITDFTYALALYYSMMASQNQVCRKNNLMEKGANKLKNVLKKVFNGESEFGKKTNFENEIPRSGEEWYEFFKEKYGAENVIWESEGGTKTIYSISELSNDQIKALIKYTGDDYANINNSLRGIEILTPEN